MIRTRRATAAALIVLASAWSSSADPFALLPVASDDELAGLSGGFVFYFDGFEIRIAIGLETRVDGQPLLRTEIGTEDLLHGKGQGAVSQAGHGLWVEVAGDPERTHVIHRVGPHDLIAVVHNSVDGISIETVGVMQIEIPNFSEREVAIGQSLVARGLSDMLDDASARALQR